MSKDITEHQITARGEETFITKPFSFTQTKLIPENSNYQYSKENPKITKTTKTYHRKVIRKTGPDGVVEEQIIEDGNPISESFLISANDNRPNTKIFEEGRMRYMCGKKTISETGEESVQEADTGFVPTSLKIGDNPDFKDMIVRLPPGSSMTQKGFQSRVITNKLSINGEPEKMTGLEYQLYSNVCETRVEEDGVCDFTNQQEIKNPNGFVNAVVPAINKEPEIFEEIHHTAAKPTFTANSKHESKLVIKEGLVRASPCQTLPKSLMTQNNTQDIILHLTVLTDLVLISSINKLGSMTALEYCGKDEVEACICDKRVISNLTNPNPKRKSVFSCVPQKVQTKEFVPEHSFVLKFNKSNAVLFTESLVLTVFDTKCRDEWIEAIMSRTSSN